MSAYFIRTAVWKWGFTVSCHLALGCLALFCVFHILAAVMEEAAYTTLQTAQLCKGRYGANCPGKMSHHFQAGVSKARQSASKRYLCPSLIYSQWSCPGGSVRDALTSSQQEQQCF